MVLFYDFPRNIPVQKSPGGWHAIFLFYFQINEAFRINKLCRTKQISFIFCHQLSGRISIFCDPNMDIVKNFEGENPRPDHDMLITEELTKENSIMKITCAKKHFLQIGNRIILVKESNNIVEAKVLAVITDKSFTINEVKELDCDAAYVIKLLSRRNHESYVS